LSNKSFFFEKKKDFGYPQNTATELLKSFVLDEPVVVSRTAAASSMKVLDPFKSRVAKIAPSTTANKSVLALEGRQKGLAPDNNEIFIDLIERLVAVWSNQVRENPRRNTPL